MEFRVRNIWFQFPNDVKLPRSLDCDRSFSTVQRRRVGTRGPPGLTWPPPVEVSGVTGAQSGCRCVSVSRPVLSGAGWTFAACSCCVADIVSGQRRRRSGSGPDQRRQDGDGDGADEQDADAAAASFFFHMHRFSLCT